MLQPLFSQRPRLKLKKQPSLISYRELCECYCALVCLIAWCGPLIFTSCQTSPVAGGGAYHVTAYKPHDPSKVVVKLSTSTQNIYVMEGDRLLMAVQGTLVNQARKLPYG
jgi:hypothetical protein